MEVDHETYEWWLDRRKETLGVTVLSCAPHVTTHVHISRAAEHCHTFLICVRLQVVTIPADVGIVVWVIDGLRSHHMSVHRLHDIKRNTANIGWGED